MCVYSIIFSCNKCLCVCVWCNIPFGREDVFSYDAFDKKCVYMSLGAAGGRMRIQKLDWRSDYVCFVNACPKVFMKQNIALYLWWYIN